MSKQTGIYIHIPFCRKKCGYCDFISLPVGDSPEAEGTADRYLTSLAKEMSVFLPRRRSVMPVTLYVGGGTPSLLSAGQLENLFSAVTSSVYAGKNGISEFTVEVNPESAAAEKLEAMRRAGVNRVSIGCQSLDDKVLKFLGRVHSRTDFLRCFRAARRAGFGSINIDLMFGIPGQDMDGWRRCLDEAAGLGPEHISVYSLTIEEGTRLHAEHVKKDDDLDADMFGAAINILKEKGYHHYEISNFSKPGFECVHNTNYWLNGEYYGFGLGAVSHIAGKRISNTGVMAEYLSGKYRAGCEKLPRDKKLSEGLMLGLRLIDGIVPESAAEKLHSQNITRLIGDGLLARSSTKIKLTEKGVMFANLVFREFL